MLLRDILVDVKIGDLQQSLKKLYFHQEHFNQQIYEDLLEQLKAVPPTPSENNMTLHVEFAEDYGTEECIWSSTYSLYRIYKRKYSLEFATIEQIANASIREDEAENKEDYIAHILWEILYNRVSEEEESTFQKEEEKRREMRKTEYCSIEDVLTSLD